MWRISVARGIALIYWFNNYEYRNMKVKNQWFHMKPHTGLRILIIGALIFALISGSAMAISKSELLASYTAQSGNISSKPMVSPA
jgi:hypothetical protein